MTEIEYIGKRGQTYVHPDLDGIGKFYEKSLYADGLPQGNHTYLLGSSEISTGPFSKIETTMTVESLTEENEEDNEKVKSSKNPAEGRRKPGVIVLPKDLPGYIIKTTITQKESKILFTPQMINAVRSQLAKDGLSPLNTADDNIIIHPNASADSDLRFRVFFPDHLTERMRSLDPNKKFAIKYYTFPMSVLTPRLASPEDFKEEEDLYFYGLDSLIERLYDTLAAADASINVPHMTYKLAAPHLEVIDLKPSKSLLKIAPFR